jgi:two-component system cell cycle response regulator
VPALDEVDRAIEGSLVSNRATMALISQLATTEGRQTLAGAITGNDPALFKVLAEAQESAATSVSALDHAQRQYAAMAKRARLQATLGSGAAIALLLLAFGIAYWRSLRARAQAERLAAENAALAAASRNEALTDALTELGNRRALMAALDDAVANADREPIVLAVYDLDGFKQYNDSFGHQAGDELLRRLGDRLVARIGAHATGYRMGGDEFCVLASAAGAEAEAIARAGAEALTASGDGYAIGCSRGAALIPAEASSSEEALRLADQRMYEQKAAGRGAAPTHTLGEQILRTRDAV